MKTTEEMTLAVHARAVALRRRRIASAGAGCAGLAACLLALIGALGDLRHEPLTENYAGASLLSDSAGGYVLAAVLAFMLGVIVTVACIRGRNKRQ